MSERYIVIPNWDRYQHYKGQVRPVWIKLHVSLLHDDEWLGLTPEQRSVLIGLWILYAKTSRKLSENTAKLSRQLGQRVTKRTLEALNEAGFIAFCSREDLDRLYAREEKRRKELPTHPPTSTVDVAGRVAETTNGRHESDLTRIDPAETLRALREAMGA